MYMIVLPFSSLLLCSAHIETKQRPVCWNPVREVEWVWCAYVTKRRLRFEGGDGSRQRIPCIFWGSGFSRLILIFWHVSNFLLFFQFCNQFLIFQTFLLVEHRALRGKIFVLSYFISVSCHNCINGCHLDWLFGFSAPPLPSTLTHDTRPLWLRFLIC